MKRVDHLLAWFGQGRLLRPDPGVLGFVDLVRGLGRLMGVGFSPDSGSDAIVDRLGPARRYVLILVDGMGTTLVERLPPESFLRRHLVAQLQAVFPSTTAAALTSLATGEHPARHSIPGWWTYLEEPDLTATTMPYVDRFTGESLAGRIDPAEMFPVAGFWRDCDRDTLAVVPSEYVGTIFSDYLTSGGCCSGYREMAEGFAAAATHAAGQQSTFTYLYLPQVDDHGHRRGAADPGIDSLLEEIDRRIEALASGLPDETRLVVTADHGLVDTPAERRVIMTDGEPLLEHLRCPPSMEQTVPAFHLRAGATADFETAFDERLGEWFALITREQADQLRLFGPQPLAPEMARRIGDYIAIAAEPTALYYQPPGRDIHIHVAVHASLSPAEMLIPLIVWPR